MLQQASTAICQSMGRRKYVSLEQYHTYKHAYLNKTSEPCLWGMKEGVNYTKLIISLVDQRATII